MAFGEWEDVDTLHTFEAQFDGDCENCGDSIYAGDTIAYIDGAIGCPNCVRDRQANC